MEVTINMNDDVRVELTEYGTQVIEEHPFVSGYYPKERVFKCPFWELMKIFGEHCYMGKDAVFVSNRISVLDSTFRNAMFLKDIKLKSVGKTEKEIAELMHPSSKQER